MWYNVNNKKGMVNLFCLWSGCMLPIYILAIACVYMCLILYSYLTYLYQLKLPNPVAYPGAPVLQGVFSDVWFGISRDPVDRFGWNLCHFTPEWLGKCYKAVPIRNIYRATAEAVAAPNSEKPRSESCTILHGTAKTAKCHFLDSNCESANRFEILKTRIRKELALPNNSPLTAFRNSNWLQSYGLCNIANLSVWFLHLLSFFLLSSNAT